MRLALVFIRNSSLREKFTFCFLGDFCQYWQNFHCGRRTNELGNNFIKFLRFSWYFLSRSATREATCIHQFITPVYHAAFHWLWKEKLCNHQKVSKHYEYYGTFVNKLFKIKQYIVLAKICQEKWFFWVWFYFMDKSISLWWAIILFLSFCLRLYPKIKSWAGNETWS